MLRLRKSPGTNSTIEKEIPRGTIVNVSRIVHNGTEYWGQVSYKGKTGYICMATSYVEKV
ncbi:MAG: SH3 domain-containing protein [Oscillospiraceae bacterium]|nr:SH3 domain-containing protein [Oscillospiraceae bacterium]